MQNLVHEHPLVRLTFRADGILHLHYHTEELSLQNSKDVLAFTRQHAPWQIAPVYITGNDYMNDDKESKKFNSSEEVLQYCSAIAFLSDTLAKKLLANFFISLTSGKTPIRFFHKEKDALKWLSGFPTILKEEKTSSLDTQQSTH